MANRSSAKTEKSSKDLDIKHLISEASWSEVVDRCCGYIEMNGKAKRCKGCPSLASELERKAISSFWPKSWMESSSVPFTEELMLKTLRDMKDPPRTYGGYRSMSDDLTIEHHSAEPPSERSEPSSSGRQKRR